jgi:hypothetical protein
MRILFWDIFVLNAFFFSERKTGDVEQYKRRGCDVVRQLETLSQMYFLPRRYVANVVIVFNVDAGYCHTAM